MSEQAIRGVPLAMQRDGWWLDDPVRKVPRQWRARRGDSVRLGFLVALIAAGDVLVWQLRPGLSLALFALLVVSAGFGLAYPRLPRRTRVGIVAGIIICLLPLIELVQPLSVFIALVGISFLCVVLAGVQRPSLLRAAMRLWWVAPVQSAQDAGRAAQSLGSVRLAEFDLRRLVVGWAIPVLATVVFAALLIGANPVLDQIMVQIARWQPPAPNLWRLAFWLFLAAAIWPIIVAWRMRERLRQRLVRYVTVTRPGLINAASVARSLVAFNALFAVQTGMDVLYLYGDAALPEGISPATYAHRGAYPLLTTALLAGLFAVLARPYLRDRPMVRLLMMLWLAQTLALVFASVWRLEHYVSAYGLTRLRLAAYIWMALVAAGLLIVVVQIWRDKPAIWMMLRSGALGAVTLYCCAFVSFDAVIARHNLSADVHEDRTYLCSLSEDVLPVLQAAPDIDWPGYCMLQYRSPAVFQPADWREWGFRNWRVRRSLAAMTPDAIEITAP